MRRGVIAGALLAATMCSIGLAAQAGAADDTLMDRRAGAWDRSVELERRGEVSAARLLLLQAWGLDSPSYEVTVRIAWLSLSLGDAEMAVAAYRRAKDLEGAGEEATRGLASALVMAGYAELEATDRPAAREHFREALRLAPDREDAQEGLALASPHRLSVELWGAYVGLTGVTDAHGGAGFVAVRSLLLDWMRLGAAFRHVQLSSSTEVTEERTNPGPGPGNGVTGTIVTEVDYPVRQEEAYAWMGLFTHWVGVDAMGLVLFIDVDGENQTVPGQAASLRLGHDFGVVAREALLFREEGTGFQVTPMAFWWPARIVGMSVGARVTADHVATDVSGRLGLNLVTRPVAFYSEGHVGRERWAHSFDGASVLSTASQATAGGSAATWFRLADEWSLGAHAALERLAEGEDTGAHFTAGIGLRWSHLLEDGR